MSRLDIAPPLGSEISSEQSALLDHVDTHATNTGSLFFPVFEGREEAFERKKSSNRPDPFSREDINEVKRVAQQVVPF